MIEGSLLFSAPRNFFSRNHRHRQTEIIEKQFISLDNIQSKFIHEYTEHILNYLRMNALFIYAGTPTVLQGDVDGLSPSFARPTCL
jgi:hypothetical protein